MSYKPADYSSVLPYLLVRDAERTLAFLERMFGAERLRVFPNADGKGIQHAETRIEDSIVMMGETSDGPDTNVHVYVAGVDDAMARAVAEGATIVQDAMDRGDGDYRGAVADGNGAVWWIARQDGPSAD